MSRDGLWPCSPVSPPHRQAGHRPGRRAAPRGPVWFTLDESTAAATPPLDIVFNTGRATVKGRALQRDPRVGLCIDDERPPFNFATLEGVATLSEDLAEVAHWAAASEAATWARTRRGVRSPQRGARRAPGPGPAHPHRVGRRSGRMSRAPAGRPSRRRGAGPGVLLALAWKRGTAP